MFACLPKFKALIKLKFISADLLVSNNVDYLGKILLFVVARITIIILEKYNYYYFGKTLSWQGLLPSGEVLLLLALVGTPNL